MKKEKKKILIVFNMVNFFRLLALAQGVAAVAMECRPEGPIYPRPRNLAQSKTIKNALEKITTTLEDAFSGKLKGGWDTNNVSVSIGLIGLDQTQPNVPLWEFHHLAPGNVNGTKNIGRDSQYLVGSVSKVISDAVFLLSGVDLDKPVTKFLPELGHHESLIDWKSITLRDLGGHLAGIPPNCKLFSYLCRR